MSQIPQLDQRIVDEYFQLASQRKTKDVAWLYGMIATYGLKPDQLRDFDWGPGDSICIASKKRSISPIHPQWVYLFNLKEKRPRSLQDRWEKLSLALYHLIAYQDVKLNISDLLLAHRLRKNYLDSFKQKREPSLVFAGVS